VEIAPERLDALELDGIWAPYVYVGDVDFLPTRVTVGADEYNFHSSMIVFGHGAVLPGRIRELRAGGRKPIILEREERYYVYVTGPT
jgi:hypothetical protein